MDPENDQPPESRAPTLHDLVDLCQRLNELNTKYLVIGGFAMMQHGCSRTTTEIDLLLDESLENQQRVKQALEILPDRAILELGDEDLRDYNVVRVADEIAVDLMLSACGIDYEVAKMDIEFFNINGVPIPFASLQLLWRMKQTDRPRDTPDRIFLQTKIAAKEGDT